MKNYDKIDRNKQQQKNRLKKIELQNSTYRTASNYKIFTVIHLCSSPVEFRLDLPYNYVLHGVEGLAPIELSYLARCSDLLLLTVAGGEPDQELMSCIRRYMPTAVIVHERKTKGIARSLAKLLGDIKICEVCMLSQLLARLETKNTSLCSTRPFMVAREATHDGQYLYLEGFMKNGLRSDKVVINGTCEGIIEEVIVDGNAISGSELVVAEDEKLLVDTSPAVDEAASGGCSDEGAFWSNPESEQEYADGEDSHEEFDLEEPDAGLSPEFDLIEKYKDYRGIMNLATCTFRDQEKPAHYKDLAFMKNLKYAQNLATSRRSAISSNKFVKLRIRVFQEVAHRFIVLFNLFEYETRNTIHNYEFSAPGSTIDKQIVVDNGYRIYSTQTVLSHNLKHNVFQEETGLDHGVVSFIGPFSFFSSVAYILRDDHSVLKLLNGESKDRVFFDRVELRGRPIKLYKRYCVIRGMFYNSEQVQYFSSVRIEGKNNNVGFIKKPLGTKGLFKAYFSHPIKHDETVTMSLYKRIFL